MHFDLYKKAFDAYFADGEIRRGIMDSVALIRSAKRVIFIGNGGSNSIASHMMEDFMKVAGKQTLAFSDPALITCFANDYGYDHAMAKWIEFSHCPGDLLVAISSSGESPNILNAVKAHVKASGESVTLSGFATANSLSGLGTVNICTPIKNYGVVECFHQVILHAILDELT